MGAQSLVRAEEMRRLQCYLGPLDRLAGTGVCHAALPSSPGPTAEQHQNSPPQPTELRSAGRRLIYPTVPTTLRGKHIATTRRPVSRSCRRYFMRGSEASVT